MKNGMWKRSLRRGAALVLALVMSLTITSCSASQGSLTARERAWEPEYVSKAGGKVHEAVPYSRRPYEHYDPAAMEQAMADFEQACASEVVHILLFKVEIFYIFDHLLQSRTDGKSVSVGIISVEGVKDDHLVGILLVKIALHHGKLVQVCQ